jgi:hypothetical protein
MTTPDYRRKVPVRQRGRGGHVPAPCPQRKHAYLERQSAVRAARQAQGTYGRPFRVYKHGVCGQYHLTSRLD